MYKQLVGASSSSSSSPEQPLQQQQYHGVHKNNLNQLLTNIGRGDMVLSDEEYDNLVKSAGGRGSGDDNVCSLEGFQVIELL